MIDTPTTFIDNQDSKEYIFDQIQLEPDHVSNELTKINIHTYLEDLRLYGDQNKELLAKGKHLFKELDYLLQKVKNKMSEIGEVFGDLGSCCQEIEAIENPPDINLINPKVSTIYKNLKTSFCSWSNLFEHQKKNIKKLFDPALQQLTLNNNDIVNVRKKLFQFTEIRGQKPNDKQF